jgi:hypothetical protein
MVPRLRFRARSLEEEPFPRELQIVAYSALAVLEMVRGSAMSRCRSVTILRGVFVGAVVEVVSYGIVFDAGCDEK